MQPFHRVGIIGPKEDPRSHQALHRLHDCLCNQKVELFIERHTAGQMQLGEAAILPAEQLGQAVDLVIMVGGDGSLLGVARDLVGQGAPLLGVNRGRLGFLTDIMPDDIEDAVATVLAGRYFTEERFLLTAQVLEGGRKIASSQALNDVVLDSATSPRMIEFEVFIDQEFVYSQRSDGLIVSTPTGSTAYALSAGGPILHPSLNAMVLVPLLPHTLGSRPLVVSNQSELQIHFSHLNRFPAQINCDGRIRTEIPPGTTIRLGKHEHTMTLVHPEGYSYYATCRGKLGWGNRPDHGQI